MNKLAVVYWSGTGNTQEMAQIVAEAAKAAGAMVEVFEALQFSKEKVAGFDALALGCPSMGDDELEEFEFRPMWDEIKSSLRGKKLSLFGSYDWGDGLWMRNWEQEAEQLGLFLHSPYVICVGAPDKEATDKLEKMGQELA